MFSWIVLSGKWWLVGDGSAMVVKKRLADWMSTESWPISVVLLLDGTWAVPDMLLHSPACCRTRWVPTSLISARDRPQQSLVSKTWHRENATGANVQVTNIGHRGQECLGTAGCANPASFCTILQLWVLLLLLPSPLCREMRNQGGAAQGKRQNPMTHDTCSSLSDCRCPIFRHRPTVHPLPTSPAPGQQHRVSSKSWSSSSNVNNRSRLSRSHEIVQFQHRRFSGETTKDSRSAKTRRGPIPNS